MAGTRDTSNRGFASMDEAKQREIGGFVFQCEFRFELAAIGEADGDGIGVFHNVRVGDDQTIRLDDDAGAECVFDLLAQSSAHAAILKERREERIVHEGIYALRDCAFGVDIDDGGRDLFHHGGK